MLSPFPFFILFIGIMVNDVYSNQSKDCLDAVWTKHYVMTSEGSLWSWFIRNSSILFSLVQFLLVCALFSLQKVQLLLTKYEEFPSYMPYIMLISYNIFFAFRLHQMDLLSCYMDVHTIQQELIQLLSSGKRLLMSFKRRITSLSLMLHTR